METKLIIDTETGGLDATKNGICSITIKKHNTDEIANLFVKPNYALCFDPRALEINGLKLAWLETNGFTEEKCVNIMIAYFQQYTTGWNKPIIIGHNIGFDLRFLDAMFQRAVGQSIYKYINYHFRDTMCNQLFLKDCGIVDGKVNLKESYRHFFKEYFADAHTAEGDVLATERLYNAQVELVKNKLKFVSSVNLQIGNGMITKK